MCSRTLPIILKLVQRKTFQSESGISVVPQWDIAAVIGTTLLQLRRRNSPHNTVFNCPPAKPLMSQIIVTTVRIFLLLLQWDSDEKIYMFRENINRPPTSLFTISLQLKWLEIILVLNKLQLMEKW